MGTERPAHLSEEPIEHLVARPAFSRPLGPKSLGHPVGILQAPGTTQRLTGTLHEALAFMLGEEGGGVKFSVCRSTPRTVVRGEH